MIPGVVASQRHNEAPPAPPLVWSTVFEVTQDSNVGLGGSSFNIRQRMLAANISAGGSILRISATAGTSFGFTIGSCYIGHKAVSGDNWDFDGTQVQVTWDDGDGSPVFMPNDDRASDPVAYALDETRDLVLAVNFAAGGQTRGESASSNTPHFKTSADESSVSDVTGYSTSTGTRFVYKVEVAI